MLLLRGVEKVSDVRPFLAPDFKALRPPEALPGAVGIMIDDLVAGLYANLVLQAALAAWRMLA